MVGMTRLDRYLVRGMIVPFLATMVIAVMLLLLDQMLKLFNFVVNEAGPVDVVWQLLLHQVPEYLGLGMPLGFFVGILLNYRRLSSSSELDCLFNSGVSLWRQMLPLYAVAVPLMAFHFYLVGYVQPYGHYRYSELSFEARSGALGAKIDIGEFADIGDGATLRVGATQQDGEILIDLFLERQTASGHRTAVTAKRGEFFATDDPNLVVLRLYDGSLLDISPNIASPRVLRFEVQDITLDLPELEQFRKRGDDEREAINPELWRVLNDTSESPERRARFLSAWHWRLVNTLTFLILPPLAIAMGITEKRRDSGVSMIVGIAAVVVFNEVIEAGETAVAMGQSPWTAIWLIYGLFALVSLWSLTVVAHIPGGRPLAAIEFLVRRGREALIFIIERVSHSLARGQERL